MHLIVSKLDARTMREWEVTSSKTEVSNISNLIDFLQSRFRVLEAVETSQQINAITFESNNNRKTNVNKRTKSNVFAATSEAKCHSCKQAHTILYRCPSFLGSTISDRIKRITELKLCKICLRPHNDGDKCQSRRCTICSRPHNSLLHLSRTDKPVRQVALHSEVNDRDDEKDDKNSNAPVVSVSAYAYRNNNDGQITNTINGDSDGL